MDELANKPDDFSGLKPHYPEWALDPKLTPADKKILSTVDLVDQKVEILKREFADEQKRNVPIQKLYERLSSFWAVTIYICGGIFAVVEFLKKIGALK